MSQNDLARALDVHPSAVSQWERNINAPRRKMLDRMEELLDGGGDLLTSFGYVTQQDLPEQVAGLRVRLDGMATLVDELLLQVSTLGAEVLRLSRRGGQAGTGST
jgi:transcriptional regulator with XRE-family HTH domain